MSQRGTSRGGSLDAHEPLLGRHDHPHETGGGSNRSSAGAGRGWLSEQLRQGGGGMLRESPSDHPGAAGAVLPPGYQLQGKVSLRMPTTRHANMASSRARRSAWIVIDKHAKRSFMHADKRSLIIQLGLGIPIRDMRLLDFNLLSSETGKLLVRDNAIILSIEHVRLIITADKVLIPREGYEHNPLSNRFVDILEEGIAEWARQQTMGTHAVNIDGGLHAGPHAGQHSDCEDDHSSSAAHGHDSLQLPFELVALEAALKEVVNAAGMQVKELEALALPALDALTKSVSTGNLERVRKVKTRHQRLIIRCETLRDELERYLHDDDDMVKMCLTRRKELEEQYKAAERAAAAAAAAQPDGDTPGSLRPTASTPLPQLGSMRSRGGMMMGTASLGRTAALAAAAYGASMQAGQHAGSPGHVPQWDGAPLLGQAQAQAQAGLEEEMNEDAAEDVENLLESYFAQIDGHYDKLRNVGEYIEDTEEYINIELDAGRNRLIRLDIVLTAASFAIAPFNLMAGILGENLVIPPFLTTSVDKFWLINATAFIMCFSFFYSMMLYMRWRKLL
ncbi:hypothetical protein D9Q98_001924 [Chlorella vulgaris]|uniref:Magnesium transporter n=1 Tax=Chlorella vulgaris TaxID=3077 RepID=A0A9D4TVA6_CHLVU|nr:hypothetical protein D9Q98_001924 [Chlorella vulgaris]